MKNIPTYKFALREDLKDRKEFLPTRAEPKATGWDVRSTIDLTIRPFQQVKIPLGFRSFCPEGWWFELKPRSSSFAKKNLHALYGTIDETYEGELVFACQYIPPDINFKVKFVNGDLNYLFQNVFPEGTILEIKAGDAIGQIIPVERQEMNVIEASNEEIEKEFSTRAAIRGAGGFGSTSK